jgi:hypothetical protein
MERQIMEVANTLYNNLPEGAAIVDAMKKVAPVALVLTALENGPLAAAADLGNITITVQTAILSGVGIGAFGLAVGVVGTLCFIQCCCRPKVSRNQDETKALLSQSNTSNLVTPQSESSQQTLVVSTVEEQTPRNSQDTVHQPILNQPRYRDSGDISQLQVKVGAGNQNNQDKV